MKLPARIGAAPVFEYYHLFQASAPYNILTGTTQIFLGKLLFGKSRVSAIWFLGEVRPACGILGVCEGILPY